MSRAIGSGSRRRRCGAAAPAWNRRPDAALTDGAWRWTPEAPLLGRLVLANSPFAGDYRLCWSGGCRPLADLAPPHPSAPIELYPCAGAGAEQ